MKKILLSSLLCAIVSVCLAQPVYTSGFLISRPMNSNNSGLEQCKEIEEPKLRTMSEINIQRQICGYENYSKLTEKWSTNPPPAYLPRKGIILSFNNQEVTSELKENLIQTSKQCQDVAGKMRVKLKEIYGVENFVCQ